MTLEDHIIGKIASSDVAVGFLIGLYGGVASGVGTIHMFPTTYNLSKTNSIVNPLLSFKKKKSIFQSINNKNKTFSISQSIGYTIGALASLTGVGYMYFKAYEAEPIILTWPVLTNSYSAYKVRYESNEKRKEEEFVRSTEERKPYQYPLQIMDEMIAEAKRKEASESNN